jgi:peptidoglycan/LPS O-acetylase OafA/YrhL
LSPYIITFFRPVAYRLFGRGYLYVDLFFVLSGYVMAVNYGQMFIGRWRISSIRIFLLKRFARVYPLYGCVMLVLAVGYWMRYGDFDVIGLSNPWLEIPLNATLMQSWGLSKSIVGQAWSVSTEMAAYLMFPWLAPLILRRGRTPSFPAILFGASALPIIAVWLAHGDGKFHAGTMDIWDGPPALLRCLGGFVLGIAYTGSR